MPGGGVITVGISRADAEDDYLKKLVPEVPGEYVRIDVRDGGCGIDADIVDRIFEPFFTTKEEGRGTGLGLAIVYGIVKLHKGRIQVTSEIGEGTIFRIYLPLVRS
jgi:two-component system, cell cycle sensor histidine kinase and response regulator CckA